MSHLCSLAEMPDGDMPRYIGFDAHKSYAYVVELREDGKRLNYRVALPDGLPAFKQRLDGDFPATVRKTGV